MKISVIVVAIILGIVWIGILIVAAPLPQIPEPHYILHCPQHNLESTPHMKWNCYYLTR